MSDTALDRRYSRMVLPRVSRTFALNIRLLAGTLREAVQNAYLLCRAADTLEDSWPGTAAEIRGRFELFQAAIAGDESAAEKLALAAAEIPGDRADLELLRHFPAVWRVFRSLDAADREAITEAVRVMAKGMSRYAERAAAREAGAAYLDDEPELDDYCWVVAGCVGVMLTRLHATREHPGRAEQLECRLALAPVVGRALQLTNILLDWPHDIRRGRCYVPGAWLVERGLSPADLVGRASGDARDLAARLEGLARTALSRVPEYLDLIPTRSRRYRLFVQLPALWALRSIETAGRDPEFPWGERRPKLSRGEIFGSAAAALVGRASLEDLRRCAAAPRSPA